LEEHLTHLPKKGAGALPSPDERLLIQMLSKLRLMDPRELGVPATDLASSETARLLEFVLESMPRMSEILAVTHFEHSRISRTSANA
jgi:hypothetical protein